MQSKKSPPGIHIVNLGCSKNLVDSENILSEFLASGFEHQTKDQAELIVINTCGFIDSAKEESVDEILSTVQERKPSQKIVVAGCLSKRYMQDLKKEIPEVDLWTGTYQAGDLLKLVRNAKLIEESWCLPASVSTRTLLSQESHHAYLKISEGCNRVCSFCAIPGIRGKQDSYSPENIIREAQMLQQKGIQELSLIAQDLTYYGRELKGSSHTLSGLLKNLLKETDIPWIRLMYAYPSFLDDDLLDLLRNEPRICTYLDMPIQHASTSVLKNMRRGYDGNMLRNTLERLRKEVPELALRTTLLIGYPGETDEDFLELTQLIQDIRFDRLGCFGYSAEDGTFAEESQQNLNRVPLELIEERTSIIMQIQQEISLERNQNLIGRELKVIIDEVAEGSEYHFFARTEWDAPEVDNRVQIIDGDATPGEFRKVQIVDASEYDLDARML
jgi:ribosomal protein S12 methylthiotransferase